MPYVMMPVPEEHVEAVMQFVLRTMSRAAQEAWDTDSVTQLFDEVDEASRSLLAFVARASLEGVDLADAEAARKLQLTVRETSGIMNELNASTREANRPVLITMRTVSERLPNGRTTDKRVLQMEPEIAELVAAAEREELARNPHPLGVSTE
jgi:hypothetical protein